MKTTIPRSVALLMLTLLTMLLGTMAQAQDVPRWARGTFRGFNNKYRADIELIIRDNGSITENITERTSKTSTVRGSFRRGQAILDNIAFDLTRENNGIRMVQVEERSNSVFLRRIDDSSNGGRPDWNDGGGSTSVPGWARGTFKGYNDKYNSDIELIIRSSGEVTENIRDDRGKRSTLTGSWRNGRVYIDRNSFNIVREDNGIRMTQIGERSNTVLLDKTGHGSDGGWGGDNDGSTPDWARGRFKGYNKKYRSDIELVVRNNGSVTQYIKEDTGKNFTVEGSFRNGRLSLGKYTFDLSRDGNGVRMTQTDERSNTVWLRRQ